MNEVSSQAGRETVLLQVFPNAGYRPAQVGTSVTLADLLAEVQEAIETYGEDALVVTRNDQSRGALYGKVASVGHMFREYRDGEYGDGE